MTTPNLYIALIHYPVINKTGDTIASAITNLDLHDIARVGRTYGIGRYYVITPLKDQKELAEKILSHWIEGTGAIYNKSRKKALSRTTVCKNLDQALNEIGNRHNKKPIVIATCARPQPNTLTYRAVKQKIYSNIPVVLAFGTAWGLSNRFLKEADYILKPIKGPGEFNHLSVRSAASIILDRLMGNRN